jgi:hypothetical protein
VYYNETFNIFALLGTTPAEEMFVTLEYKNSKTGAVESTVVPINCATAIESDQIHKFWARESIKYLETLDRVNPGSVDNQIIDLSKQYNIPSGKTAYIAIERRDDPVEG